MLIQESLLSIRNTLKACKCNVDESPCLMPQVFESVSVEEVLTPISPSPSVNAKVMVSE